MSNSPIIYSPTNYMENIMVPTYKNSSRRFGVEIEYNAYDNESRSRGENDLPKGIYETAEIIRRHLKKSVDITKWQYTQDNVRWNVKPDSSCGIEVCSPPLSGESGVNQIESTVNALVENKNTKADRRCSMHVHVEIADLTQNQIVFLIRNWVRFEIFFLALCQQNRWLNQYCIPVGFFSGFDAEQDYYFSNILHRFSEYKYFTINLYHYGKNKKKTVEFRVMGSEACMNGEDAKNWCKLMLCFVDTCANYNGMPSTTLSYGDFDEALDFLRIDRYFNDPEFNFWIIEKLNKLLDQDTLNKNSMYKFFWKNIVENSQKQIINMVEKLEKLST